MVYLSTLYSGNIPVCSGILDLLLLSFFVFRVGGFQGLGFLGFFTFSLVWR